MRSTEFKKTGTKKVPFLMAFRQSFREKSVGFYVAVLTAGLSLVNAIVYVTGYASSEYFSWSVFVCALLAALSFAALCWNKFTLPFAPVVLGLFDLAAFLAFIRYTYAYLSEVFYGGITAEAFKTIEPIFIACVLLLLIGVILSIVAICLPQRKKTAEGRGE